MDKDKLFVVDKNKLFLWVNLIFVIVMVILINIVIYKLGKVEGAYQVIVQLSQWN